MLNPLNHPDTPRKFYFKIGKYNVIFPQWDWGCLLSCGSVQNFTFCTENIPFSPLHLHVLLYLFWTTRLVWRITCEKTYHATHFWAKIMKFSGITLQSVSSCVEYLAVLVLWTQNIETVWITVLLQGEQYPKNCSNMYWIQNKSDISLCFIEHKYRHCLFLYNLVYVFCLSYLANVDYCRNWYQKWDDV